MCHTWLTHSALLPDIFQDRCSQQEKQQLELEKETKKDPEEGQA